MRRTPLGAAVHPLETLELWLVVALALRIVLALALPTLYHPDEIFQSLEPAHRLAFGYGAVSWEWRDGIRSWVFPGFLAAVIRSTSWIAPGSRGYLFGVNLAMSLLSLSTVWFGWAWGKKACGTRAAALAAAGCALYFGLVGLAPKALSEAIATYLLLPGLYFGYFAEGETRRRHLLAAGFLCALAACLRIQLAPAVLFAVIFFCWPNWRRALPPVACGAMVPVLFFGLVDWLTWGHPWESFSANIRMNLVQGRSHLYGTAPWFTYLWVLPVVLVPSCFFWLRGARRSPFLAAFVVIFVVAHSMIAHKEERFLLPVIPLCLMISALGIARDKLGDRVSGSRAVWTGAICFLAASIVMGAGFYYFDDEPGSETALKRLSTAPGVCGVALYDLPWTESGGYVFLHRNLPLIPVQKPAALTQESSEFNVIVAPTGASGLPGGFVRSECAGGVCISHRAGTCAAVPAANSLNGYLKRHDE